MFLIRMNHKLVPGLLAVPEKSNEIKAMPGLTHLIYLEPRGSRDSWNGKSRSILCTGSEKYQAYSKKLDAQGKIMKDITI